MKISDERINEWKTLIEERKQRRIKVDEFCKEKNITIPQFYYYHKQVSKHQRPKNQDTVNSVIKPIQIVNHTAKEAVIRFILPNSVQCVLPRDMSLAEIKGILEAVMTC